MAAILIVDDQQQNRDLLARRLAKRNYTTIEAASGQQALDLVAAGGIDLVLLDIRMPGMNGEEVLVKLRESYSPTQLPVIMVTAETDTGSLISALELGADDYVTKPVDFPVLLARMENKLAVSNMVQRQMSGHTQRLDEQRLRELITQGENHQLEFKSTLRWNIHANRVGKEIEAAWTKTAVAFLNSDGGTLLIGVGDDGAIIGTAMDQLKNDDKYLLHVNNTIKNYIGLEYISHIAFELVPIEGKKVLVVECKPYPEAVFLKNGTEDEFYARFGPSSRKLSTKEVLTYMQQR